MIWGIGLILAASAHLPIAVAAQRPGFDCAKAATPMERAICANPKAAAADGRMAARYSRAWRALSPEGRQALLANQRAFLRGLASRCDPRNPNFERRLTRDSCLVEKLDYRTHELAEAVKVAGGHVFLTLTRVTEKPVTPDPDEHNLPPIYSRGTTLVQIDRPRTPAERRWNAAMRRWVQVGLNLLEHDAEDLDWAGSSDVEISITAASPTLISALLWAWGYSGGAHGVGYQRVMIWALPLGRALTDRDIVWNTRDPALDRLLGGSYNAGGHNGPDGCDLPKAAGRIPTLTPKAVTYWYDSYELGAYTCSGNSEIPWSRIERFLRPAIRAKGLEVPRPLP